MKATLDWPMLRAVLAVAEEGSMTRAARVLGQSQPTISRLIRAAEEAVGEYLFERHGNALVPSAFCDTLLPDARDMRDSLRRVARVVAGDKPDLHGRMRIAAPTVLAMHVLPQILARLRVESPQIMLDVVTTDTIDPRFFPEADIALHMTQPQLIDTVAMHLGDLRGGLYAAETYLTAHGMPETVDDLRGHAMVGFDRCDSILRALRDMGVQATPRWFQTRTDDAPTYWAFVLAGCGIGVGHRVVAERTPEVVAVLPDLDWPSAPVWLTAPQRLRHQPRVAAVWEVLEAGMKRFCE